MMCSIELHHPVRGEAMKIISIDPMIYSMIYPLILRAPWLDIFALFIKLFMIGSVTSYL